MREVYIQTRAGPEVHRVYPVSDYPSDIKPLADWRKAEEGNWVITDDEHVIQVLRVYYPKYHEVYRPRPKSAYKKLVRTAIGTYAVTGTMDTKPRANRFSVKPDHQQNTENYKLTGKAGDKVVRFARFVARGMDPQHAFSVVWPKNKTPDRGATLLLRRKEVVKLVARELEDLLSEMGMDRKFALENLKGLIEDYENPAQRLGAVKELMGLLGMANKIKQTATLRFKGIPRERLGAVEGMSSGQPLMLEPGHTPLHPVEQPLPFNLPNMERVDGFMEGEQSLMEFEHEVECCEDSTEEA